MAALAPLTRDNSALYSNQRDELTCAYHVFSKLLLKNVVELFYPLPIDLGVYNTNKCNRYLDTRYSIRNIDTRRMYAKWVPQNYIVSLFLCFV